MASGEQLSEVEDWFGFAELSGESSKPKPPASTPSPVSVQSQKVLEHDDTYKPTNVAKTDDTTNQDVIVVPIVANKQGKTKYKVLARQKVKDEEPKIEEKSQEDTHQLSPTPSLQSMQYVGNNTWRGTYRRFHKSFVPSVSSVKYNPDSREVEITAELEAQQLEEKKSVKHVQGPKKRRSRKNSEKKVSDIHEKESTHTEKKDVLESTRQTILDVCELNNHETQGSSNIEETVGAACQQECDASVCNTTDETVGQITDQNKDKIDPETECDQNRNIEDSEINSSQNENKEGTEIKSDQSKIEECCARKSYQNDSKESSETISDQNDIECSPRKSDQNENKEGTETESDQNENESSARKIGQKETKENTDTENGENEITEGTETDHEKFDSHVSPLNLIRAEDCVSPCTVKLKQDPSIDNLQSLTDKIPDNKKDNENEVKELHNEKSALLEPKEELSPHGDKERDTESSVLLRRHSSDNNSNHNSSMESLPATRHLSMDDSKGISMVFNADHVQLRKSGRLKSAKCSSRYRGDYGIRVETYSRLVHTKGSEEGKQNDKVSDHEEDRCSAGVNCNNCSINKSPNNSHITNKRRRSSTEDLLVNSMHVKKCKECISNTEVCEDDNPLMLNSKSETNVTSADNICAFSIDEFEKDAELTDVQATCALKEVGSYENSVCTSKQDDDQHKHYEHQTLNSMEIDLEPFKVEIGLESHESSDTLLQTIPAPEPMDYQTVQEEIVNVERATSNCGDSVHGSNVNMCPNSEKQICDTEGKVPCTLERRDNCDNLSNTLPLVLDHNETTSKTANHTLTHSQTLVQNEIDPVIIPERFALKTVEQSDYVHSVGKSVNKKQNQATGKKFQQEKQHKAQQNTITVSPDVSPTKGDPVKVLEDLRTKLFEKAGAVVQESDKPKQFESKLISSKRRQSVNGKAEITVKEKHDCQTSSCSCKPGRVTPKCSTPKNTEETGIEILEEVAQTLSIIQQAKRKTESLSEKAPKPKRQKFEKKKFMLRSMFKQTQDQLSESCDMGSQPLPDHVHCENNANQPSNSSSDNIGEPIKTQEINSISNNELNTGSVMEAARTVAASSRKQIDKPSANMEGSETDTTEPKRESCKNKKDSHSILSKCRKAKSVKCQACSHTFKNKELLRKHYPCRIRQTRTWSQNVLRPNRAYRRNDMKKEEKFKCRLPKSIKSDGKQRPKLLKPRKTKFRRVKGKRRRRLYILLQYLMAKRKVVQWPHLSVSYTDLSFKEQCMYKIGLSCSGNSSEGVESYSKEESAWFEVHRRRQKEIESEPLKLAPKDDEIDDITGEVIEKTLTDNDTEECEPEVKEIDTEEISSEAKEKEVTDNAAEECEPEVKEIDTDEMLSEAKVKEETDNAAVESDQTLKDQEIEEIFSDTKEKEIVKDSEHTANEISCLLEPTSDYSRQIPSSAMCEARPTEQSIVRSDDIELNEISKSIDMPVNESKPCEEIQSDELTDNSGICFIHSDNFVLGTTVEVETELDSSLPDPEQISDVSGHLLNCDSDSNEIMDLSESSQYERSENKNSTDTYRLSKTESQSTYQETSTVVQPVHNINSQSLEQTIINSPYSDLCSTENLSSNDAQENPCVQQISDTTCNSLLEQTCTDTQYRDLSNFENMKGNTYQESSIVEQSLNKICSSSDVQKVDNINFSDSINNEDVNDIVCETIDAILVKVVELTDTVEIKTNTCTCTENDQISFEPTELLQNRNLVGVEIDKDTNEADIQKQPEVSSVLDKVDSRFEKDFPEDRQSLMEAENCLRVQVDNPNLSFDDFIMTKQETILPNTEFMCKDEKESAKNPTSLFVHIPEEIDNQNLESPSSPCLENKENDNCLEDINDLSGDDSEFESQEHHDQISLANEMDRNEKLPREIEHNCIDSSNNQQIDDYCTTDNQSDLDLKEIVAHAESEERTDNDDTFEHAVLENNIDQITDNIPVHHEASEPCEERPKILDDTDEQSTQSSVLETCDVSEHLSVQVEHAKLSENGFENLPPMRFDESLSPITKEEPFLSDNNHSDIISTQCRKNDSFSDISDSTVVNETDKENVAGTTICYEQNGILISENLLTGDKNIVCQSQEILSNISEDSQDSSVCTDSVEVSDSASTSNVSHSVSVETEEITSSFENFNSSNQSDLQLLSPCKSYEIYVETCDRDSRDKIHLDKHSVDGKQHLLEENKSASTITYKINGIVICENLVTGEKTVIETEQKEKCSQEEDSKIESENDSLCSVDSRTQMSRDYNFENQEYEDSSKCDECKPEIRDDTSQESSEAAACLTEHTAVSNEKFEEQISSITDAVDTNRCENDVDSLGESYQESTDPLPEADAVEIGVIEEECVTELDVECNTVENYEMSSNTESLITEAELNGIDCKGDCDITLGNEESVENITAGITDENKEESLGSENTHLLDTAATKKNSIVLRENIEIYNCCVKLRRCDDLAYVRYGAKKLNKTGDDCEQEDNDFKVDEDTPSPSGIAAGNHKNELILQNTFNVQNLTPEIGEKKKIDKTQELNYHTEIEVFRTPDLIMVDHEESSVNNISVYDVSTCDDQYAYQSEDNTSSVTIELDTCKKCDLPDNDTETPPVLVKVDEPCYLESVYDDTVFSEDSQCSIGDPPTLIPEEETVYDDNLDEPHFLLDESQKTTEKEDDCLSNEFEMRKPRAERHFLDVLGDVCPKEDENVCQKISKEKMDELSETKSAIDEDYIGRHFSDVIDNTVHSNNKQRSQFSPVLEGYGNREVTLAEIREILKTENKTKKMFTKESLLKLRSDIAHLLTKIKTPVKKDPVWLKRDSLTSYHKRKGSSYHYKSNNNDFQKYDLNGELFHSDDKEHSDCQYTDDDSECSDSENSFLFNRHSETKPQWQDQENEKVTKGGITDNILQMLTSFEDTGSVAMNMSNLLDILAKNLGFSSKGQSASIASAFDSDSDSDYSGSDEIGVNGVNQETTKEPTVMEKLNEAFGDDEPPCLDDIPLPDDILEQDLPYKEESFPGADHPVVLDKENKSVTIEKELSELYVPLSAEDKEKQCISDKIESIASQCEMMTSNTNTTEIESEEHNENILTEEFLKADDTTRLEQHSDVEDKCNPQSLVVVREREEDDTKSQMSFPNSVDNPIFSSNPQQVYNYAVGSSEKVPKEKTGKGSGVSNLLKSITQLNTIETDDESDSGEVYDDFSVSRRMLELKALSVVANNSDVESDISDSEIFDPNDQSIASNCSVGETENTTDISAEETTVVMEETCDELRLDQKTATTSVSTSNQEHTEIAYQNIQQDNATEDAESNYPVTESIVSAKVDDFETANANLSAEVAAISEMAFSPKEERYFSASTPIHMTASTEEEIQQNEIIESVSAGVRHQSNQADDSINAEAEMQPNSADMTVPADVETQQISEDKTVPGEAEIVVKPSKTGETYPAEIETRPCLTDESVVVEHESQQNILHETFPTQAEMHSKVDETAAAGTDIQPSPSYVADWSDEELEQNHAEESFPSEAATSLIQENESHLAKSVTTSDPTDDECQVPPSPAHEKYCTVNDVESSQADVSESTKTEIPTSTDDAVDFKTEMSSKPEERDHSTEAYSSELTCANLTCTNLDNSCMTTNDIENIEGFKSTVTTKNINNEQVSGEEESELNYETDTSPLPENKTNDLMPFRDDQSDLEVREVTSTTTNTENVNHDLKVDDCKGDTTKIEIRGIAMAGVDLPATEMINSSREVLNETASETEDIKLTTEENKTETVTQLTVIPERGAALENIEAAKDSMNFEDDDDDSSGNESEEIQLTKSNGNSKCSNDSSINSDNADELCDRNAVSRVISLIYSDIADHLKHSQSDRESALKELSGAKGTSGKTEEDETLLKIAERHLDENKTNFSLTEEKEEDIEILKNNNENNNKSNESRGSNEINDQLCEKDKEKDEKLIVCESEINTDSSRIVNNTEGFEPDRNDCGELGEVEIETAVEEVIETVQTEHDPMDEDTDDYDTEVDDGDMIEAEGDVFYQEEVITEEETAIETQQSDIKQLDSDTNLSEHKKNRIDSKQTHFDKSITESDEDSNKLNKQYETNFDSSMMDEDTNSTMEYEESGENLETILSEEFSSNQPNNNTSVSDSNFHSVNCEADVDYTEKENVPISCFSDDAEHGFNEFSEGFFETIAEKVKRKQRERLQRQAWKIPQQLSRIRPVPAVKQISIFRSSMLDQRIRQNSLSSLNIKCLSRKKRKRCKSLPKEIKLASLVSYGSFGIKPCSVRLTKLKQSTIQKYIHSNLSPLHEKTSEETNIDRPPIKLRIKLSDIIMPITPYSPFPDTYSSTDEHTSEEMEASPVYSNTSQLEPAKAVEEPVTETEAGYRSKSVDNISQRLKPFKIKLSDLKMSKSKSCDFEEETLPCDTDVGSVKPKQNSDIAKQICKHDLQLSESDSGSDSDTDVEMPAMDKVKDTVQECIGSPDVTLKPSVNKEGTNSFSWTKITFQEQKKKDTVEADTPKERSSLFLSDSLQRELAILSKENQIPSCESSSDEEGFEDVSLQIPDIDMDESVSVDKGIDPQILRQHNSDTGLHNTLAVGENGQIQIDISVTGPDTDCQEASTDPVCETISNDDSGIQKLNSEIDEATTGLEREIFRDETNVSTDNGPEMYSCVVETGDDFETCEAVQTLETIELCEVSDNGSMVIVDYKDMQETDKIPSHIQTEKCIDKSDLFNSRETNGCREQLIVSDHVRPNNETSVSEEVIPNKYLYGISEESQSSADLIEEQVLEELTIDGESITITSNEVDTLPIAQISVNSGFSQLSDSNTEPGHQCTNQYRQAGGNSSALDQPIEMSVEKPGSSVFSMEDVYRVDSHHLISQAAESVENSVEMDYDSDVNLMMNNLL